MKVIYNNGTVGEITDKQEELHVIRHTAAHIMAQAIKRLFPEADFAYGPANEKGFYYDVDLGETKLTDEERWNFIEHYFTGQLPDSFLDNSSTPIISARSDVGRRSGN